MVVASEVAQMKWWGWGDEHLEFDISDKPDLWPFIKEVLQIEDEPLRTPPVRFEDIEVPAQQLNEKFLTAVKNQLQPDQIRSDKLERLVHAYGKSFRDLLRIRRGIVEAAPDVVLYPQTEVQVGDIVQTASEYDVIIIPFGGGSNIAGCLEAHDSSGRMVVSLDMKRMNKVLMVDHRSNTAQIQAGVMGPHMEEQLNAQGVTLGHFPDSFEYSSLGGWVATRSAGMQSDKYGKIEDMVLSLRMVTPSGTIVTRTVPKSSNGIDVNHICIGSEGILGIITEATLQIHPLPQCREIYGYLFPDFDSGIEAIKACIEQECTPMISRLNDAAKTALSFAYKTRSSSVQHMLGKLVKSYLNSVKKYDLRNVCLMLTGMEGDKDNFRRQRRKVNAIYRKFGGFNLGISPGRTFERGKYDFPYLRDFVMDRNIMADVSETSTVWSNIGPLYAAVNEAVETAIRKTGSIPYVGCHISHSYRTGTSLYFTFGCEQQAGMELEQYLFIKKAAEDAFISHGGTLSHHHAVGTEHLPWVTADISETGIKAVKSLKEGLDPKGIMNPGKIIPVQEPLQAWGLSQSVLEQFENGKMMAKDSQTSNVKRKTKGVEPQH
jgi:alkyldihydroxyacetonephosphate synthase